MGSRYIPHGARRVGGDGAGWDGRRSKREGTDAYLQLMPFAIQEKLTQHCKAITLRKKKLVKKSSQVLTALEKR